MTDSETEGEPNTSLCEHAVIRQAPHTEALLTDARQKSAREALAAALAMPYMESVKKSGVCCKSLQNHERRWRSSVDERGRQV
jgi:hypothetical protein